MAFIRPIGLMKQSRQTTGNIVSHHRLIKQLFEKSLTNNKIKRAIKNMPQEKLQEKLFETSYLDNLTDLEVVCRYY